VFEKFLQCVCCSWRSNISINVLIVKASIVCHAEYQWHSKALRGPDSAVTWEPSIALAPRAEAGSPKCWEWEWDFGEKGLLAGLGSDVTSQ